MHVKTHLKRAVLELDFNRIFVDNKTTQEWVYSYQSRFLLFYLNMFYTS